MKKNTTLVINQLSSREESFIAQVLSIGWTAFQIGYWVGKKTAPKTKTNKPTKKTKKH